MLGYIDLIYGIWVYNDELQINCTFCSGPMIFGRVMAFRFWNLAKYLVVITFFAMLGDIDLTFGIWVYNDELQIQFAFCSGPTYSRWALQFGSLRILRLAIWPNFSLRAITRPQIIGPERNVNLICISSLYTHTKNQVNISKHSEKMWWQLNIWPNFKVQGP